MDSVGLSVVRPEDQAQVLRMLDEFRRELLGDREGGFSGFILDKLHPGHMPDSCDRSHMREGMEMMLELGQKVS